MSPARQAEKRPHKIFWPEEFRQRPNINANSDRFWNIFYPPIFYPNPPALRYAGWQAARPTRKTVTVEGSMRRLGGKRWRVKDGPGWVTDSSGRRLFLRLELRPILVELIPPAACIGIRFRFAIRRVRAKVSGGSSGYNLHACGRAKNLGILRAGSEQSIADRPCSHPPPFALCDATVSGQSAVTPETLCTTPHFDRHSSGWCSP